jgi:antitoxin HicB
MKYLLVISHDPDGFSAFIPDFNPGILVSADSREDAIRLGCEALTIYLSEVGEVSAKYLNLKNVPDALLEDSLNPEAVLIEPAPMNPISLEIERIIEWSGLTLTALAKRMQTSPAALVRLKDPFYWGHSVRSLREIASATGMSLEVKFKANRSHVSISM